MERWCHALKVSHLESGANVRDMVEGPKIILKARWCIDLGSTEDHLVATFWLLKKVENIQRCRQDE
jgi:hypothetical protein